MRATQWAPTLAIQATEDGRTSVGQPHEGRANLETPQEGQTN